MDIENYQIILKIILIGDCGVGKTHLLRHYIRDKSDDISATIAVEFSPKLAMLQNGKKVKLQLWDTSGQEQYQSITQAHYKRAAGALIVYDITNQASFNNVQKWYNQIFQKSEENIKMILVANKQDQDQNRAVSTKEGQELASQLNMLYIECSAQNGNKVDQAFSNLIEDICADKFALSKNQSAVKLQQLQTTSSGCCGS